MAMFGGLFLFLTLILVFVIIMIANRKKSQAEINHILKAWLIVIGILISLPLLAFLISPLTTKMIVDPSDIYGEYVIDREMFKGKQTDWQYDHYRFEIKKDNTLLFYVTDKEKILKTHKGHVTFLAPYASSRIVIHINQPRHHILESNPTMYREIWSFYYVFESKYYGNMFFKKGEWEEIDD